MAKIWQIASVACLIAAAVLLLLEYYDAAFVLAALGAVAWILNHRTEIRRKNVEDANEDNDEMGTPDDEDKE